MPEPERCLLFVRPLNQLGVRYVISGSVAAMLCGEPRLTHEVNFRSLNPTDREAVVLEDPAARFDHHREMGLLP